MSKPLSEEQVRERVRAAIEKAGSVHQWAKSLGVTWIEADNAWTGLASDRVLGSLGVRRVVSYEDTSDE